LARYYGDEEIRHPKRLKTGHIADLALTLDKRLVINRFRPHQTASFVRFACFACLSHQLSTFTPVSLDASAPGLSPRHGFPSPSRPVQVQNISDVCTNSFLHRLQRGMLA